MGKTAEEVTEYVLKHMGGHHEVAKRVIADLRESGWLRAVQFPPTHVPTDEALCSANMRLTRERDEAQAKIATLERDLAAAKAERDAAWAKVRSIGDENSAVCAELAKIRSREASPAMLRVVEALAEHKRRYPGVWDCAEHASDAWGEIVRSFLALAAPAVEKPRRYEPRICAYGTWGVYYIDGNMWALDAHAGATQQQAERIAAVLNGAEAAR